MVRQIHNLKCFISVIDGPPYETDNEPWQSFKITPDSKTFPDLPQAGVWWKANNTEEEVATSIGKAILLMLQGDE